jgi:exoribonuclease-2
MTESMGARERLGRIAARAMEERGFGVSFPNEVNAELASLEPRDAGDDRIRDLTGLLWCSIDNDDTRDLDQLSVTEPLGNGSARILIAIADVDSWVGKDSAIDRFASKNTTSVYTGAQVYPMLPERLSTDLTSLNEHQERLAMVTAIAVDEEGHIAGEEVFRARVYNHAKLSYGEVGAWLDGQCPLPPRVAEVRGLDAQIWIQDRLAQLLRTKRYEAGALDLESIESRPIFEGDRVKSMEAAARGRAKELIEDFMIAANSANARFLQRRGYGSIRRIVRAPKRWPRIVEVAQEHGVSLPPEPDPRALEKFLRSQRQKEPERFADLSLVIVKLLGAGQYALSPAHGESEGHFGLAVKDYAHSTAPNRRFPDLVTQRLLKAAIRGQKSPYSDAELEELALRSTEQQDDAAKVERQVKKSAAALMLEKEIGETYHGVITGASDKGVFVRVFSPPVEGKINRGSAGLDVGEKVRVKLTRVNVDRGFIDFDRA